MTTNPILTELAGLSDGAKQALLQAHGQSSPANPSPLGLGPTAQPRVIGLQQGQQSVAAAQPPPIAKIPLPGQQMPELPAIGQPSIKAPIGTSAGDQAEIARLRSTGSGADQIEGHPFLKGIAEVASHIGSMALPGLASQIPGTEAHHNLLLNRAEKGFAQDLGSEGKEAQIEHERAETANVENPNLAPLPTDSGYAAFNPKSGTAKTITDEQGNPLAPVPKPGPNKTPEETAFEAQINSGADPVTALRNVKNAENIKDPTIQQQYLDAMQKGDQKTMDQIASTIRATSTQPKIDVHTASAATRPDPSVEREYIRASGNIGKLFDSAQKQRDALDQATTELGSGAVGQALGTIKSLTGLAGGQGSGVRITQAELNSILHARGIQGDFDGWVSKIEGEGALDQKKQLPQLQQLLHDVDAKLKEKEQHYDATLDTLSQAKSPQEIRKAESQFRKQAMTGGGGGAGQTQGNEMITVQIPGQPPGQIHASQLQAFKAKYPNAEVKQ